MTELPRPYDILIPEEQIRARVRDLGAEISRDYQGQQLLLVGVLRGVVIFLADLVREITVPVAIDFMAISSYGPTAKGSGAVKILKDLDESIEGRHVLLVEDIIDTGLTARYILRNLQARRPASLKVCTLLNKTAHRIAGVTPDYVGFELPPGFVIGYGLDYQQMYRNLPFLAAFR